MKYDEMTWGTMEAVVNKLGGMDGVQRFLRGALKVVEAEANAAFSTFQKITLSVYDNVATLRKAIADSGNNISDYGEDLLAKMSLVKEPVELELVCVSVKDLGLKSGATIKQIYDRARKLGLDLCPAQVGPELRLAYQDQPIGEWLLVAMEQITDRNGHPSVFIVGCDVHGVRWLDGDYAYPSNTWSGLSRWVFVRRA
ncbi:MAG: hypothetical protein QY311_02995 [Candidatus Paceibacterota bacterium]|nr:MAG: hypothetical protein QY311_02995 [Candidatus Paceibacterota bacterium]